MPLKAEEFKEIISWKYGAIVFLTVSLFSIHFSPSISSIGLAVSFSLLLLSVQYKEIALSQLPFWIWLLPAFYLSQWLLDWIATGSVISEPDKLILKSPFLFAPLILSAVRDFRHWSWWLALQSLILSWIVLASTFNYLKYSEFYNQMVLESKPIPLYSQVYHIEFSLLLALLSIASTIFLFINGKRDNRSFEYWILLASNVVNVAGLHLLSTRTGLIAFWLGLAIAFFIMWPIKKSIGTAILVFVFLLISALFVPTVKNRITNSLQDLTAVVKGGDLNNKSFGQRWVAWKMGLKAISEKPVTGYGLGKVSEAIQKQHNSTPSGLKARNRINPHNQYIEIAIQSGIAGFLVFSLMLILAYKSMLITRNQIAIGMLTALIIAMLFESILERQAGILCFGVLLPLFSAALTGKKDDK